MLVHAIIFVLELFVELLTLLMQGVILLAHGLFVDLTYRSTVSLFGAKHDLVYFQLQYFD